MTRSIKEIDREIGEKNRELAALHEERRKAVKDSKSSHALDHLVTILDRPDIMDFKPATFSTWQRRAIPLAGNTTLYKAIVSLQQPSPYGYMTTQRLVMNVWIDETNNLGYVDADLRNGVRTKGKFKILADVDIISQCHGATMERLRKLYARRNKEHA